MRRFTMLVLTLKISLNHQDKYLQNNLNAMSQRLNAYFGASPELRHLADRAARMQALQQCYTACVPPSLARASRVGQLENQVLTICSDNGAVAAKLRQLAPELMRQFQRRNIGVADIQVRVQISVPPPQPRPATVTPLSAGGRERVLDALDAMRDSPLKEALRRLAEKAAER
jgi:hypothetical protein